MCGILGVLGLTAGTTARHEEVRISVLERVKRLRHRGPDWSGMYVKGRHILAHERLSIVDPSNGAQPLFTAEKDIVLAVNGEIYNHVQLRKELKDPGTFLTASDCEVILHLYKEQGSQFLNRLNGIFAFIIVDERDDSFFIARDHMGICPLYIGRDAHGSLWISSELKALHDVCVTFEDFPPGHFMSSKDLSSGGFIRWYNPLWHNENWLPTKPINLDALREGLIESVTAQLMSDVPYGVLLSGGLDSSLVSAIAAKVCRRRIEERDSKEQGEAWFPHLHSFSIGLPESPDLKFARQVAKHIGSVHHEFNFTVQEGLDAYRDVIYHLETYDVTTVRAATPMYLMSRKIKAMGIKMVLSGEGSDEAFGGYLYFHKAPNKVEFHKETVRKLKSLDKFDVLRANKSTAAWGVEARVPFLDKVFLDYVMEQIDPADKMCGLNGQGRMEKWILRKAFEGWLPDEVLWRQKEQFSDGVGYSWIDSIKAHAEKMVSDVELTAAKYRYPYNTPPTKEAYLIRTIFEGHFPGHSAEACVPGGPSVACSTPTAILWDESFKKFADCSGRSILGVHVSAYDQKHRDASKTCAVTSDQLVHTNGDAKGPKTDAHADGKTKSHPSAPILSPKSATRAAPTSPQPVPVSSASPSHQPKRARRN
jgi:asparagine synthase (glutamine-hydrolysing)